jgi:hypothetical protein
MSIVNEIQFCVRPCIKRVRRWAGEKVRKGEEASACISHFPTFSFSHLRFAVK